MSSRNIAVRKEVYDALRRESRSGESFTQVIQRLLDKGGTLEDLHGVWRTGTPRRDGAILSELRGRRGRRDQ